MPRPKEAPAEAVRSREELVRRVASSGTFEKSLRLRAFFLYVCQCALDNQKEAATEQQIGIHVYDRQPGYNPNEDNIVRSQARLLRMKLEHYFANEGKEEPVIISIPKGRYLPLFEPRTEEPVVLPRGPVAVPGKPRRLLQLMVGVAVLFGVVILWLGYLLVRSKSPSLLPSGPAATSASASSVSRPAQSEVNRLAGTQPVAPTPGAGEIRIAAGHTQSPYTDAWGRRWEADRYYDGGVAQPGPRHFFPPVADEGPVRTMRTALSADLTAPEAQRQFRYDIPAHPGAYELRLFFADPLRQPDSDQKEDAQNTRHFHVNLNGHPLLVDFDPIADAGSAAMDVRVFRDVYPDTDGKIHLEFLTSWGNPAFVSAIELTPGTPGKLKPIRIVAHKSDLVDDHGEHWSADNYFIEGRTLLYGNSATGPKVPTLYTGERHGNFSYAIPVAPGSYTVRLHFLEAFFSPLIPAASCRGAGCRVFDVSCNGVLLLQDFDIFQTAGGAFRPVVREFHGLHPNGQGKLLLSFSPKVDYAEVRAIEVIDEAK
ncbi:MAG TPA: malectin domain-containing carbohydrate-binding protein [Verrucomicrobiae bacterium]|nr:malectin domain-containing carbohydrate-binding protein [Verrucomicrobiae bacterium]